MSLSLALAFPSILEDNLARLGRVVAVAYIAFVTLATVLLYCHLLINIRLKREEDSRAETNFATSELAYAFW